MNRTGLRFVIVIFAALFFSNCAGIAVREPSDLKREAKQAETRELVAALEGRNFKLITFKGTGKFKLRQQEKTQTVRVAWAGSYPNKLRIALRNLIGQPTASFASDGQWLYLVSHTERKFYKKRVSNPNLQRLISIPITSGDIVSILTGRLPLREYDSVELIRDETGKGYVLVFETKWRGVSEKIYLDGSKMNVKQIEMFEDSYSLQCRIVFDQMQYINGFEVPLRVLISNGQGNRFQLDIERYWANAQLSPSTFVLTPAVTY